MRLRLRPIIQSMDAANNVPELGRNTDRAGAPAIGAALIFVPRQRYLEGFGEAGIRTGQHDGSRRQIHLGDRQSEGGSEGLYLLNVGRVGAITASYSPCERRFP